MTKRLFACFVVLVFLFLACDSGSSKNNDRHGLTDEEWEAFTYTNFARTDPQGFAAQFLAPLHAQGTDNGAYEDLMSRTPVPALQLSDGLIAAARAHSQDLNENCKTLQHDSCDGTSWYERIAAYYSGNTLAENAAGGFVSGLDVVLAWIIDSGVPSLGHRQNLLNPNYVHVGFGQAGTFWTQDFGAGGE